MKTISAGFAALLMVSASAQAQAQPHPAPASDNPPQTAAAPSVPPVTPVKTARVLMLRWFTSDVAGAEKFYQSVFGMTTVQRMGDNVRILIFPGGTLPGMILVQTSDPNHLKGSFVAQVSDVKATLAAAAANGGKLLNTQFGQNIQGQQASSSHFEDPDGNVVEVVQIGALPK
jgi:predicted enzyme related to lactoylglutathione lyase